MTSFRAIRALASQSTFEKYMMNSSIYFHTFLLLFFIYYLILHKICSVLTGDILGIDMLQVQYLLRQ